MPENTEVDILKRIIDRGGVELSPEVAQELLSWRFSNDDRARMTELSGKASEGELGAEERRELEAYLLMGHLLAIAHSKARRSLQRHQPAA